MNGSASIILKKAIGEPVSFATAAGLFTVIQSSLPRCGMPTLLHSHRQNHYLITVALAAWTNGSWTNLLMTNGYVVIAVKQKNNPNTLKAS